MLKEIILAGQLGPEDEDIKILVNCEVTHLMTWRHIPEDVDQHYHRPECLKFFFLLALQPNADYGLLNHEVFLDQTQRRTTVGRTPLDE